MQSAVVHASMDDSATILQRRLSTAPVILGSPSTPTRSTFPFKPAAVTPQGQRSECPFRPRPVVPALTPPSRTQKIYSLPKRCKSFPTDDSPPQANKIEPPAWLTDFTGNIKRLSAPTTCFSINNVSDDISLFPVPVNNDDARQDREEYWWLDDMSNWEPLRDKPTTTVRNFLMELRSETIHNKKYKKSLMDNADKFSTLDDALKDLLKLDKTPRVSPELASLQQQVLELKRYVMSAHHFHEDKREKMHSVLHKIESVITGTVKRSEEAGQHKNNNTPSIEEYYRKTKVGLTGGSLVTAGLVLIPAPVIPGILVVYGGLLVLASEFDSAKTAVETMQIPMKEFLKDEEDPSKGINDCFHVIMWEETIKEIGYAPETKKELDEDFEMIMRMKPWKDNAQNSGISDDAEIERARREKKNAMKRYARQLLLLEDPDDTQENQAENIDQVNDMMSRMGEISNGVPQNDKRVALLAEN
ncbi:hypothetical protein QTG54_001922 [Skeletonema marinoi]|uniref:Uncharacterized protein n=1 Tax=Skeletonema marinoi TaxID=267567 RepID=A0AAD9DJ15_9STRA|nr:hypothetical protein QTG54_001922 [Skeletonema marinoi]